MRSLDEGGPPVPWRVSLHGRDRFDTNTDGGGHMNMAAEMGRSVHKPRAVSRDLTPGERRGMGPP